jgi:hypothetical protein
LNQNLNHFVNQTFGFETFESKMILKIISKIEITTILKIRLLGASFQNAASSRNKIETKI